MQFWKKRLQRVAAMVCSVALVASMMPTAAFATEPEPTPTPEPTPVVETAPTPEPSESPESTDAAVTTPAPGTDADSTAAPSEEPTETPDGSPAPSEEPTGTPDGTSAPSEKPVESPEPSEVPAEQVQSVPQPLSAAPAAAPEAASARVVGGQEVQSDDKIFTVEYYPGLTTDAHSDLTVIAVDAEGQTIDQVHVGEAYRLPWTMEIRLNDDYKTVYELTSVTGGEGVNVNEWSGDFNDAQSTTFTWSDDGGKATIYLHIKEASHVLQLSDGQGTDLGTITWKEGGKQLTTVKVYLNYDLVYTSEPLAISNALNNFVLDLEDGYYFNTVTMEDIQYTSSIESQIITYNSVGNYNHLTFGSVPSIFDGTNTVSLYVFNYEDGVQVKYDRYVNNGIINVDAACPSLDIAYTVNGYNTQFTYTDLDSYIYLPKDTKVTTTANVQDGYYFEYWHTADAAVDKNNLYTIGADGNPILQYTGPLEGQIGHVAFSQSMVAEYASAFTSGIIGLYMTDGDRPVIDYNDYRITYCPNGENVTPADNQVQYFYRSSKGTYGTVIRGCMFTRDGYEFLGWNTKPDGTGTPYTPDAVYGSENGENDLTLYAQWKKIDTPPVETSVALEKTILSVKRGDDTLTGNNIPATFKVGDVVTYQVEVENTGNVALSGLTITDTLTAQGAEPENLTGDNGEFTWEKGTGNWIGTVSNVALAENETKTYKYTYTVVDADKGNTITNAATVNGDGDDPTDDGETETPVENPDVTVTKSLTAITRNGAKVETIEDDTELKVGDEITYEIKVENTGNVNLSDLTVRDEFSGYAKPGDIQEGGNTVKGAVWQEGKTDNDPNWTLTITNIDLSVEQSKTYTYTYTVNQADAGNTLTNTAAVSGDELDPYDPDKDDEDERPVEDDGDITLRPADITIYMGGEDGYAGAAGGDSKSLPEPGFYITLPANVEKALQDAGYSNGEAADLSGVITEVTATTTDGVARRWTMQKYGESASTAWINNQEHFVYRIVPGEKQPAISVSFTNEDGTPVTEDKFTLTDSLSETYFMSLNTASVDVETISLTFNIKDQIFHCGYDAKNSQEGTLTVRYASEEHDTTKAVTNGNKIDTDNFGLLVEDGQKFNINQKDAGADGVDVTAKDVSLLVDSLVGGEDYAYTSELYSKAVTAAGFKSSGVWGQYLDLVDAENGNAWLTPEGEVTVFWPYPAGVTKDTGTIKLYHFEGLDRDMATDDVMSEISNTDAVEVQITRLDDGFTFKTSSFSPFVLVQDTTQPSGGEDKPTGGDDGNNDNNNNNTNTNNNTTTVNVTSTAAAQPQAATAAIPQTGDAMPVGLLGGLAAAAAAGFAALFVIRKRKQNG